MCLLGLFPFVCHANNIRVAVPSSGLAFSVGELSEAGETAKQRVVTEASNSGLTGCLAYCTVLEQVWGKLLPVFHAQQDKQDLHLVVLRSPHLEAVSFADGTIAISENFISHLDLDEAQIAFVLAHEASHFLLQHERQALTSILALMPSKLARTPQDLYCELEYHYFSMSDSFALIFHQIEFEADEIGMQLAALAGYAPQLQLRFMEQRAMAASTPSLHATHPTAPERLQRLRDQFPLALRLFESGQK